MAQNYSENQHTAQYWSSRVHRPQWKDQADKLHSKRNGEKMAKQADWLNKLFEYQLIDYYFNVNLA